MTIEFKLPYFGQSVAFGNVVDVLVSEGDQIAADQDVIAVRVDEAVRSVPCPYAGVVAKVHVTKGQTLPPGMPLLTIEPDVAPSEPPAEEAGNRTENESIDPIAAQPGADVSSDEQPGGEEQPEKMAPFDATADVPLPRSPFEDSDMRRGVWMGNEAAVMNHSATTRDRSVGDEFTMEEVFETPSVLQETSTDASPLTTKPAMANEPSAVVADNEIAEPEPVEEKSDAQTERANESDDGIEAPEPRPQDPTSQELADGRNWESTETDAAQDADDIDRGSPGEFIEADKQAEEQSASIAEDPVVMPETLNPSTKSVPTELANSSETVAVEPDGFTESDRADTDDSDDPVELKPIEPKIFEPAIVESEMVEPEMVEPEMVEPEMVESQIDDPQFDALDEPSFVKSQAEPEAIIDESDISATLMEPLLPETEPAVEPAPTEPTVLAEVSRELPGVSPAAHFDDADITELERIRQASLADYVGDVQLTMMTFVLKATVMALKQHPAINVAFDSGDGPSIHEEGVHVGVTLETERGAVTPILPHVDQLSIPQIARTLARLVEDAEADRLGENEHPSAKVSISNLGSIGSTYSAPVLHPSQAVVLNLGRSRKIPVAVNDAVEIRLMQPLSLSYNPRIIEAGAAARFLNEIITLMETPGRLLLAP